MVDIPFYVEDLTVADTNLPADGSTPVEFDIDIGANWAKIRSIKLVQLVHGPMSLTFEIWEIDSDGYDPEDRATFYMRLLRRTITQEVGLGAEYHEIINPELLYRDRDKTRELHCRLLNLNGGTASDFAVVVKCGEIGESL